MVLTEAIVAVLVVLAVVVAWKFLKFMFKIGVVIAAAILLYFLAQRAGWL